MANLSTHARTRSPHTWTWMREHKREQEEAATLPDGDGARVHARKFVGLEILVRHAEDLRHVLLQVAERQLRISKALVVVKDVASHDRLDPHAKCLVGLDDVGRGGARRRWRERDEQREQQRGRGARRQAALRGGCLLYTSPSPRDS